MVCSRPECQARRRSEYRRRKRLADPEYAQVVRDSQQKWREANPNYQKNYWHTHPEAAARNRQLQHQRDQKRHVGLLVKNTLVSSRILILQAPSPALAPSATS